MVNVRTPQITSLENAIRIYYENIALSNAEIKELFIVSSSATIARLKRKARDYMIEHNILPYNDWAVNTEAAYAAWGLDIKDLEFRFSKLQKFKLLQCKE